MKLAIVAALASAALAASPLVQAQSTDTQKDRTSQAQKKDPSGKLARQDARYFREMAQDNLAEVQAGKLAQQRAQNDEVKQFAEKMVEDHGRMLEEQRTMAKSKGVDMPRQPAKAQQSAMRKLRDAKGGQFDRAYMSHMVEDHEKGLKKVREAAKNAKDPELKAMAEKAAPDIEKHLQMAKQISDTAAAGGTAKPARKEKSSK